MKPQKTREKILSTCLRLFNVKGLSEVTTAGIAEAAAINEGNLYYYFKKKGDIINALFEQYSEELLQLASSDDSLRVWFDFMWRWRFIYRDNMTVFALAPTVRPRLKELSDQVDARALGKLLALREQGRLKATDAQLKVLLENCWIIISYWIHFLHSRHGITRVTKKHLDKGYQQMSSLFQPYLVPPREERAPTAEGQDS